MNDKEFLDYCESMTGTPRCGLVTSHIARLLRLAGYEEIAKKWSLEKNYIVDHRHDEVRELVAEARERMKTQ